MDRRTPLSSLAELAYSLAVKIEPIHLQDANIFQRESGQGEQASGAGIFRQAIRVDCDGVKARIAVSESYWRLEVKANLNEAWSINAPDRIILSRKVTEVAPGSLPLFAVTTGLSPRVREILRTNAFHSLLTRLNMRDGESLHFYRNMAVYYARSISGNTFLQRARELCCFLKEIQSPDNPGPGVNLPDGFNDLDAYVREWAIHDDDERSRAIAGATSDVLADLVAHVVPRLPGINQYLDSHSDERAAMLGDLAETAVEAEIELQKLRIRPRSAPNRS